MRIALGADHGGFDLKAKIVKYLKSKGHEVKDFGCFSAESCDYPKFGSAVADAVSRKKFPRGVLICKSGIGMSIVANKSRGVRAALVSDIDGARSSREHNDANVLILGSQFVSDEMARRIALEWLKTPFEGGRHEPRVRKISDFENRKS